MNKPALDLETISFVPYNKSVVIMKDKGMIDTKKITYGPEEGWGQGRKACQAYRGTIPLYIYPAFTNTGQAE
jgi:hypothetical protein